MGRKVEEVIDELEEKLANAKLVREKFPDARVETLPDGRVAFVSRAALEVADRVDLQRHGDGFPVAVTYVQLQDGPPALRVYADHEYLHHSTPELLAKLRASQPEAYATLVRLAKTR